MKFAGSSEQRKFINHAIKIRFKKKNARISFNRKKYVAWTRVVGLIRINVGGSKGLKQNSSQ